MRNTSSTASGMTPGSPSHPDMVCVFPLDVTPYANTVPSVPSIAPRTAGLAAARYTSLVLVIPWNT